jgi:hypothetical protein
VWRASRRATGNSDATEAKKNKGRKANATHATRKKRTGMKTIRAESHHVFLFVGAGFLSVFLFLASQH